MKLPKGKYCGYLRKSRADIEAEARGEEDVYAKHERILIDLTRRLGITLAKIYREVPTSGERISARPEMIQLLSDVEAEQWAGVLVVEVERLARGDTMDQGIVAQAFKFSNTLIVTPMRTFDPLNPNDEEYFEFNLFMSRREFKTITRRLQDGRRGSVKQGKYIGNKPPYGYLRQKLPGNGFTLVPNPEQANIVKLIFTLYTDPNTETRMGTSKIANHLNSIKIPTMKNLTWTVSTVNSILRNPTYAGKVKWGNRPLVKRRGGNSRPRLPLDETLLADGLHEAIVDIDTFNNAMVIMASNSHPPAPKSKLSNPLAGIIICGVCEKKMVLRPYSNKNPSTIMCPTLRCPNVSSYFHIVEQRILEALRNWMDDFKLEWNDNQSKESDAYLIRIDALKNTIKSCERKHAEYKEQLGSLDDLLEQKVYSVEKYIERSKTIEQRIHSAEEALSEAQRMLDQEIKRYDARSRTIPQIEHLLNVYHNIESPAEKNALMKSIVEKVIYKKEKSGRWGGADHFTLKLKPKIPR